MFENKNDVKEFIIDFIAVALMFFTIIGFWFFIDIAASAEEVDTSYYDGYTAGYDAGYYDGYYEGKVTHEGETYESELNDDGLSVEGAYGDGFTVGYSDGWTDGFDDGFSQAEYKASYGLSRGRSYMQNDPYFDNQTQETQPYTSSDDDMLNESLRNSYMEKKEGKTDYSDEYKSGYSIGYDVGYYGQEVDYGDADGRSFNSYITYIKGYGTGFADGTADRKLDLAYGYSYDDTYTSSDTTDLSGSNSLAGIIGEFVNAGETFMDMVTGGLYSVGKEMN